MTLRQSAIGLSLVFIVTVLPVQSAFAQVCRGAADLTPEAHLAGGAAIGMSDEAVDLRGVVAGGHAYLAEFHAGVTLVDVADATVFGARLIAGGQIPVTLARRVMTCPLGTVAFGYSPDFDGLTLSLVQLGGGAAIGGIVSDTDTMQTILAGSILAERVRARFANDAGGSLTQRVTVTTFEVAMGLVFSRRYTLRPAIAFEHVEGDWTRRFLLVLRGPGAVSRKKLATGILRVRFGYRAFVRFPGPSGQRSVLRTKRFYRRATLSDMMA